MDSVLNTLSSVASPWGYVLVGVLAMLETSALVGLAVPGETALLIGGFLAYQGKASVVGMAAVATLGAIVGDSIGYQLGRRVGPRLRASAMGQRVGEARWLRAEDYLRRKGGRAVFLGRFVGVLRALVPMMAGLSRMPYRKFLAWTAAGGLIWAPSTVLVGYAAGSSYRRIEHIAGRATLLVLVLLAIVVVIVAAARFAAARQLDIAAARQRFLARPRVQLVADRYGTQLRFFAGRFRPGAALGLSYTVGIVVAIALAWAFGTAVNDVLARGELSRLDEPVREFFGQRHEEFFTRALYPIELLGSLPVLAAAVIGFAAWTIARHRDPRTPILLAVCLLGAGGAALIVRALIDRPGPDGGVSSFPSVTVAAAAAFFGGAAVFAGEGRAWRRRIGLYAVAVLAVSLVGFTTLYLERGWLSDVVGGLTLGALSIATVFIPARTLGFRRPRVTELERVYDRGHT